MDYDYTYNGRCAIDRELKLMKTRKRDKWKLRQCEPRFGKERVPHHPRTVSDLWRDDTVIQTLGVSYCEDYKSHVEAYAEMGGIP